MNKNINGILVAIGGAENKGADKPTTGANSPNAFEMGVLSNLRDLLRKDDPCIEIITSASHVPDDMAEIYMQAFDKLGCGKTGHLKIEDRNQAFDESFMNRVTHCDAVLFSGGNQLRLASIVGGTPLLKAMKDRYHNERFLIAGSSAGAMAMSSVMINRGMANKAYIKGEVSLSPGLGFLDNAIIDTHFDKRGRFNRLLQAVAVQPGIAGIGLSEDTGIIIANGNDLTAIGSGIVTVVDGSNIRYNDIAEVDCGMPIAIENMIVHVLSRNFHYNLDNKIFAPHTAAIS